MLTLAVSAAGAYAQKQSSDKAVIAQAEAQNANTAEGYRVAQEQSRAAAAQAFEQQTDRARKATQQVSMARVLAAQGGPSLAANAINITAGAADDFSRIDAGLTNQQATARDKMAALQTNNQSQLAVDEAMLGANQTKFFSQVGAAAVSAGAGAYSKSLAVDSAKNFTSDYDLSKYGVNTNGRAPTDRDW
ncbi:hypothetical protein QTI51_09580 [Variovorax sp. J22G73]|uniref:hypothetical protein n=1 Tax=unclassified Variovorax TaxID=663243 RepID=UPI002578CDF2|nr:MULTISPECIES: hypothetical protein [unclassified Variovorax]MDM0006450.1 hypothetical protein [Variovorax sp. J22R203]MDM0097527.1 hypothetical protein [Variovorax sp. J22G73]